MKIMKCYNFLSDSVAVKNGLELEKCCDISKIPSKNANIKNETSKNCYATGSSSTTNERLALRNHYFVVK
jgi:hypothetical protein